MAQNEYEKWLQGLGVTTMTMEMNGERCGHINTETGDVEVYVGGNRYELDEDRCPPMLIPLLLQIVELESLVDNLSHDKSLVQYMRTPEQLFKEKMKAQEGPIILEFDKDWWLKHGKRKK